MPDLSGKKLDDLFRRGSEQYDFEYDPAAWADMERLLERERRRRILFWWLGGLLGLLLLGTLLCLGLRERSSNTAPPVAEQPALLPQGQEEPSNPNLPPPPPPSHERTAEGSAPAFEGAAAALPSERKAGFAGTAPENHLSAPRAAAAPSIPPSPAPPAGEHHPPEQQEGVRGVGSGPLPDPLPPLRAVLQVAREAPTVRYAERGIPSGSIGREGSPPNRLVFALALGTTWTATRFSDFGGMGWKGGVQVQYQYGGRLSFGLGALLSRIEYTAGRGEYSPPKGFWTRKIAPRESLGKCTVLEVPVTLGWYPKGYVRSGWFAEGGLVSYLMLRERYYYFYDETDPDLVRMWQGRNENRHWFGIGQFSLGYQQVLFGGKQSLQWAPFVQVPLAGVGHGRVRLDNIGLNLRFNFHLGH